jgi:serine/threonine protein kinase
MIGRAISHYRVLSALGSGGMGVVYLAEDERLGRQVALKFLPADSTTSRQALERFRVEARAASSLSHPGICAIYDIGDDEGTPYIVMEALKGESLRDRINRGPLKIADLLDIAIQLADALDAAHSQGIIHRDIKPSNIFVGDKNRTKILDFGLAKLAQSSASLSSGAATRALNASTHRDLTMPGSAVGTVSYMSPEQARGEEVDTRTDLFSLGVVLYEMSSGIQAFGGSTQAIVFDAILNRTPQPVTHINPLIPPRLEALIATALEKDRDLRHQHASDFEAELKRLRRDLESGQNMAASRSTVVTPSAERRSATTQATESAPARRSWIWGALSALVVIALAIVGFNRWSDIGSRLASGPEPETTPVPSAVEAGSGASAPPPPSVPAPEPVPPPVAPSSQPAATPRPLPQPQLPPKPTAEPRPQVSQPSQPSVTPTPQRPPAALPTPSSVTIQTPAPTLPPPSRTAEPTAQAQTPAPSAAQPQPTPAQPQPSPAAQPQPTPAAQPSATQPRTTAEPAPATQPPRAATAPSPSPSIPPTSPVESDDALVRGVLRTYERAIETKNVDLFRSVWPGLSAADESRLRTSFSEIDSQQMDIVINELRIEGRTATVRISRRDTMTMRGGRRQTTSSRPTLHMQKGAAGWIITEIK